MTKQFEEKVLREGTVDTKKYRYLKVEDINGLSIKRLPIEYLGRTAAIDGWEKVKVIG